MRKLSFVIQYIRISFLVYRFDFTPNLFQKTPILFLKLILIQETSASIHIREKKSQRFAYKPGPNTAKRTVSGFRNCGQVTRIILIVKKSFKKSSNINIQQTKQYTLHSSLSKSKEQ
jgi:hypothetical protein